MADLKRDMVQCVNTRGSLNLTKSKLYTVLKISSNGTCYTVENDVGDAIAYLKTRFEIVQTEEQEQGILQVNGSYCSKWGFHVSSLDAIHFRKIADCLSYKEPVAFIDVVPDKSNAGANPEFFIVIHDSIMNKVYSCRGGKKLEDRLYDLIEATPMPTDSDTLVGAIEGNNVKARILKLVKKIKDAPYKKGCSFNGQVTVVMPVIK